MGKEQYIKNSRIKTSVLHSTLFWTAIQYLNLRVRTLRPILAKRAYINLPQKNKNVSCSDRIRLIGHAVLFR